MFKTNRISSQVVWKPFIVFQYETHNIKKDAEQFYPFVFNDLMGLEEGSGRGVRVEDIKLAMMGHVKEGYKFNPASPLSTSDSGYNPSPSPEDRVHVVVCLYSGNTTEINSSVLQKMKAIRETASDLGIPQLAVLTKFDEACPETEKDLKNTYKSKLMKRKVNFSWKNSTLQRYLYSDLTVIYLFL
uniref:Uncharacterized protein n=1 Tax=Oreochromis niloticus TaxID=8128 RepID=A0A669EXT4_ORENI